MVTLYTRCSRTDPALAAHTVIIKGTQIWQSGGWHTYSEADVLQMMGRAGRPQFGGALNHRHPNVMTNENPDKDGVAIIMCDSIDQRKYESLVGGEVNLESWFVQSLRSYCGQSTPFTAYT